MGKLIIIEGGDDYARKTRAMELCRSLFPEKFHEEINRGMLMECVWIDASEDRGPDDIRETVIAAQSYPPPEGVPAKVLVIDDAECMAPRCRDELAKLASEMPEHQTVILLSSSFLLSRYKGPFLEMTISVDARKEYR